MFTRAKICNGATYLANHLSANDYYAEGQKVTGVWIGKAAIKMELHGVVSPEDFESLRINQMPGSSARLTPRTKDTREATTLDAKTAFKRKHGRMGSVEEIESFRLNMKPVPNRVAFYDFECSAQKSVSILYSLAGDERLLLAHQRASQIGFAELERFAARQNNTPTTRSRIPTGNLCAAAFTHDTSRALDPQLHTHFVVANATCDPSGKWFALDEFSMLKAIRYAGKVYQNALAREVQMLGYDIVEARDQAGKVTGFEIAGVSEGLRERFSKRRREVEAGCQAFVQKYNREPTRAEISVIARETRSAKLIEITTPEVHARQRAELHCAELEQLRALYLTAQFRHKSLSSEEDRALSQAVSHLFERTSVLPQHEILAEALNQALGSVDLERLKVKLARSEAGLLNLVPDNSNPLLSEYATKRGLQLEQWAVAFVNGTRDKLPALNETYHPKGNLSLEQRNAVRAMLSTRDQVFSFRGAAGAGKTTTLKEVHAGLQGKKVYCIAPTAAAARVLHDEGFSNATTVTDFLQNVARRESLLGSIVICDEAGLKSNQQGAELLRLAQQYQMRVILVGDVRQHVAVEAGDFLRILETHSHLGRCEVADIRRQQQAPQYKTAITHMAAGDARGGMELLNAIGWIKEEKTDYLKAAADHYWRLTRQGTALSDCLAIAPTWMENHRLTEEIRARLKSNGKLHAPGSIHEVFDSLQWTVQQRSNDRNYVPGQWIIFSQDSAGFKKGHVYQVRRIDRGRVLIAGDDNEEKVLNRNASFDVGNPRSVQLIPGDKVLIRANDKSMKLINGQILTVHRVDNDGSIETTEGITLPSRFKQWGHGYVVTSHKSQGRTCRHVIVAAENLNAKAVYVGCSRGKVSCAVFTPDKARLLERMPSGNRRAALDALADARKQATPANILARVKAWAQCIRDMAAATAQTGSKRMAARLQQVCHMFGRWNEQEQNIEKRRVQANIARVQEQTIHQQHQQSRGIRM